MPVDLTKHALGWRETGDEVLARSRKHVPAYQAFLDAHGLTGEVCFTDVPLTDKNNYLLLSDYGDLLANDCEEAFAIFSSSGSGGHAFYWPQLKEDYRWSCRRMRVFLETSFQINRYSTLVVVAMAMGSWIGGDYYSWVMKNVALEVPYRLTIISPGSNHQEVIDSIHFMGAFYQQVLVIICPSLIGYLRILADELEKPLPFHRLRFLTMGEAFPEALRLGLSRRAKQPVNQPLMFSIYGSADTGALAAESLASVALRQILYLNPAFAEANKMDVCPPHFFHYAATDAYIEVVNGELCVTRWQGIPLVRYNLHDHVQLMNWNVLREAVISYGVENLTTNSPACIDWIINSKDYPDVIAVSGRSSSMLTLGGTNITESILNAAFQSECFSDLLTGIYRASVHMEGDRSFLRLDIEFHPGVMPNADLLNRIYPLMIEVLCRLQPEFALDWRVIYRRWDDNPSRRVLRLKGYAWPALSRQEAHHTKFQRFASPSNH